ncbi:hypothetical protein C0993_004870 [Termitomyces sp. T159_Od127]|nr:hypothetical protein C0993_004870 [Termitomyces sp. T159_Od127]
MRDFLVPEDGGVGLMVDVTRRFWPDRKGMYTCWNTKISARESNYGTRIDYVMVTRGLLPWVKAADIQPHIKGSDHCPVYVDLHDEIVDSNGETIRLQDVMRAQTTEPPRIASRFWDEPVGPGYDKGRAERRREDVDATWRCDFFKWSSEARREMRA